jgi:cytochrome c oxidase subunit 3
MATLTSPTEPNIGSPPPLIPLPPSGGGGGDESGRPDRRKHPNNHAVVGVVVLMIASMMTFGAMFCAFIVRKGMSNDWHKLPLPHILWWNTGVLVLSSVVIDIARRMLRRNRRPMFNILWSAGTLMGTWFLIGQIVAWSQLEARGFHLFGNPSSAFFYVLTWAHAAHVVGALAAVYYVEFLGLRYELDPSRRGWVNASSIFWHFLDVMWLGIMGLFVFQA